MWAIVRNIIRVVLVAVLPFFLLIRGSIFFQSYYDIGVWSSISLAALCTSILLFLYLTMVYRRLTSKVGDADNLGRRWLLALGLVGAYCGYALFFISSNNLKNPELRQEINDLHPTLRLGVSTFILMDKDMIITDGSRVSEDYQRMGLKTNPRSKHFIQPDGYAHAIDLRTNTRHELRNRMMQLYFELLGFDTLRHGGTSDHLHVSI